MSVTSHLLRLFALVATLAPQVAAQDGHWPAFRGPGGSGVCDDAALPVSWDADPESETPSGVLWRAEVPGLGHSSPIVWGDRVYVCTAVPEGGVAELMLGKGGQPTAANDERPHQWLILCFHKGTGEELWRRVVHEKATQANSTLACDGERLVACLGSEGLHCFDLDGERLWRKDLGVVDISKYGIGWGYASSPALHGDRVVVACDDPKRPFVAAFNLSDGEEVWRVDRSGICERSWGTPFVHASEGRTQVVVNGWPIVASYDLEDGAELWRIEGGGDNPIPTPFAADGHIVVASAHGPMSPIYMVRPGAEGNITPSKREPSNDGLLWSTTRGGSYMSTPVVYRGVVFLGSSSMASAFDGRTGKRLFKERLGPNTAIIASPVAGDGKVYLTSEEGTVHVLEAGAEFKVLATCPLGEPCFATPAISEGSLFFRTTGSLIAIGAQPTAKGD